MSSINIYLFILFSMIHELLGRIRGYTREGFHCWHNNMFKSVNQNKIISSVTMYIFSVYNVFIFSAPQGFINLQPPCYSDIPDLWLSKCSFFSASQALSFSLSFFLSPLFLFLPTNLSFSRSVFLYLSLSFAWQTDKKSLPFSSKSKLNFWSAYTVRIVARHIFIVRYR